MNAVNNAHFWISIPGGMGINTDRIASNRKFRLDIAYKSVIAPREY